MGHFSSFLHFWRFLDAPGQGEDLGVRAKICAAASIDLGCRVGQSTSVGLEVPVLCSNLAGEVMHLEVVGAATQNIPCQFGVAHVPSVSGFQRGMSSILSRRHACKFNVNSVA